MSDFIPDDQFQPDPTPAAANAPMPGAAPPVAASSPQQAPVGAQPAGGAGDFIPDDQFQPDEEKYGGLGDTLKAGAEGALRGVAGPIGTGIAKVFGASDEDIRGREEAHPWAHTIGEGAGLIGGLVTGTGEAALAEHLGEGAMTQLAGKSLADLGTLGKVTTAAGKAAIENAVISAGDETSKMMINDPNTTAQSAIQDIGLSAALGGLAGGALDAVSPLWAATKGSKVGELINDFSTEMKNLSEKGGDLNSGIIDAGQAAHDSLDIGSKHIYENGGLKEQEIRKLIPENSDEAFTQAGKLHDTMRETIAQLEKDQAPPVVINRLRAAADRFETSALGAVDKQDSYGIYDSINKAKQELGSFSKFDKGSFPTVAEKDAIGKVRDVWSKLQSNLEDENVWGKAGQAQRELNGAYSELQGRKGPLANFRSKFMTEYGSGEWRMDPGKVQTFLNQSGKASGQLRKEMAKDFLEGHDNFHDVIQKIYDRNGATNPIPKASTAALRDSLDQVSPGRQLARYIYEKGGTDIAAEGAAAYTGVKVAGMMGLPEGVGALIGEHALGGFYKRTLPLLTKGLATLPTDIIGAKAAADYASRAGRAINNIGRASANVFKAGRELLPQQLAPTDKERAQLDKRLDAARQDPNKLMNTGGKIGTYLPSHGEAIAQTTGNAVQYLNSLKPSQDPAHPLDTKLPVNPVAQAQYNRALDIAQQPLMVLQHIKEGTLQPQDVVTLKTVYPSLYQQYSTSLTQEMNNQIAKGEIIPYKTKVGLSMFLGQPLDSSMVPSNIVAAQMTSQSAQQAMQGALKPSQAGAKGLSKLGDSYMTGGQKREQARQVNKD